jgi:hypothetical protein
MSSVFSQPSGFCDKAMRAVETVECALLDGPDQGLTNFLVRNMPWAIFNPI